MTDKKKYLLNILLILTIGGLSLYFSIGGEYKEVWNAITSAKIGWLIVMVAVMFVYFVVDALSLWYFGRFYKKDYSFKQAFTNSISGIFFNGVTPFASGGQFAQVYIFNKQGIPPTESSSILLMCFICYQSVLVAYTGLVLIIKHNYFLHEGAGIMSLALLGFLINFLVILGLFFGAKSRRFQNFITNTVVKGLSKIHIVKDYETTSFKIQNYLTDFRTQIDLLTKNISVLAKSSLCNFIKLTVLYSMPFFACKALNVNVGWNSFLNYIGLCSFIYLINAFLPIPGASGGSEGCYILLFNFLGTVAASSTMFLWRFVSYYMGMIVGGIVFSVSKEINRRD